MGLLRDATAVVLSVIGLAEPGMTQVAVAQTPQSQCSVLSGRPCHPSFCGVFHGGPCMPYYLPPIGEDLRLTIVSTDDNAAGKDAGAANSDQAGSGNETAKANLEAAQKALSAK